MDIIPSGQTLGARVEGIDLANPLPDSDFQNVLRALGQHGVLCFPKQTFETPAFRAFASRFGDLEVNVANLYFEPGFPEIMILSNQIGSDGKPVGLNDAGQGWHTDMSYSKDIALANVLHAQAVPVRNGKSVGETQFRNMHAAYDELPDAIKHKIEGRTATHDFEKFWEVMRLRPGSRRNPLTEEQKRKNEARKKQKVIEVKEIKLRPNIDDHDYDVKMRAMKRFLEEGDKVKVTLRFRGREMAHMALGHQLLARVKADFETDAKVEQEPRSEGRQIVMVVAPK